MRSGSGVSKDQHATESAMAGVNVLNKEYMVFHFALPLKLFHADEMRA